MIRVAVLGAAAGGGFPQWNSNGEGCRRARAGDLAAPARTQAGLAVSADGEHWVLLNASPDLRQQINATASLHPRDGLRSSPITAVVLTGGDVDVVAGLLTLRERQALDLYATSRIHAVLDANPIFEVLARDLVQRRVVDLDAPFDVGHGLKIELFAVPGKVPLYLETDDAPAIVADGTTTAARISDGASTLIFAPGCAAFPPELAAGVRGAALVLFDGTLWCDDEMIVQGLGPKTGRRMGHMSVDGPGGSLAAFATLGVPQKVFIHINNSNPILLADSEERAKVERAGWQVAYDGMELEL